MTDEPALQKEKCEHGYHQYLGMVVSERNYFGAFIRHTMIDGHKDCPLCHGTEKVYEYQ